MALTLVVSGCGKVADPLPPVVRIPEPVSDFSIAQVGYNLRFVWTNPVRNIDQTPSQQFATAVIRADDEVVLEVPASAPGQQQSEEIDARGFLGTTRSFSVQIGTGGNRFSTSSNRVSFSVVVVPGTVSNLTGVVDQDRIFLSWSPPADSAELVDSLRIYRSGEFLAELPGESTSFEDREFVPGTTYTYVLTALRLLPDGNVREGPATQPLMVEARDSIAPAAPGGLQLRVVASGVFLIWSGGTETDIAGYRVFRATGPGAAFTPLNEELLLATGYDDAEYLPGDRYAVSAVDRSGNESPLSEPVE